MLILFGENFLKLRSFSSTNFEGPIHLNCFKINNNFNNNNNIIITKT